MKRFTSIFAATLASAALGAPAIAQSMDVSDEKLNEFVELQLTLAEVQRDYRESVNQETGEQELAQKRSEAQNEMDKLIQQSSLSRDEVETLSTQVQQDDELWARYKEALENR